MNWFLSDFNIHVWRLITNYQLGRAQGVTLIYGPYGVGKSTMLRHLYRLNAQQDGSLIVDALSFSRQYAYAAQEKKLNQFRERYRGTRLLLLDDLQLLEGKIKTIEELQHTYENVVANGGKLVFTLQGHTPNLDFLGERLASRLMSGLVIPIERPMNHEIKRFISETLQSKHIQMEESVINVIAERTNNLSHALDVITQFIQYAEAQKNELNFSCFHDYWKSEEDRKALVADPMNIIRAVAVTMEVSVQELLGQSRKTNINEARQLSIYIIRTLTQISYPAIACYFNRKHSAMIASCKKINDRLTVDQELFRKYESILSMFNRC